MLASHSRCGDKRVGYTKMIHEDGFSGIVGTTWDVESQPRTLGR